MKLLVTISALCAIFSVANSTKANWTDDHILPTIIAEQAYIRTYLNASEAEFATLHGAKDERLTALQDYHHLQFRQMLANHGHLRACLQEKNASLLAEYGTEGKSPAYLLGAQAEASFIQTQFDAICTATEQAFVEVMLKEEALFVATQQ